jgi:hypothetical protein
MWITMPPQNHHFRARNLQAPEAEEVVLQVKMVVNPDDGHAQ